MAQSNHMWLVKTGSKKKSQVNNQSHIQSRPERDTKPLDYAADHWIYLVNLCLVKP